MALHRIKFILFFLFCISLIALQIGSTACFRVRLADYFCRNHEYAKCISVYSRVLVRNNIKQSLSSQALSEIYSTLADAYAQIDLRNAAIKAYSEAAAENPVAVLASYNNTSLQRGLLPAIGVLESGNFDIALEKFKSLTKLYPDSSVLDMYTATADMLLKNPVSGSDISIYFSIGDAYISNGLFNEAKEFFTKRIIDYGVGPMDVLRYLNKQYSPSISVKRHVWGDNIYVVLESFEAISPRLSRLMSNLRSRVKSHSIVYDASGKGFLETLDIDYTGKGYDFWAKEAKFLLKDTDPALGIRIRIKSHDVSAALLYFEVIYPQDNTVSVCTHRTLRRDIGGGWFEYAIEGLYNEAKAIAPVNNRGTEEFLFSRVIVDTQGVTNKFLIGNVELFLLNG